MKSLFITIIICSLSFIAKSQETTPDESENDTYYYEANQKEANQKDQYIREAGKYLQKHSKQYYIGLGIMAGGYVWQLPL